MLLKQVFKTHAGACKRARFENTHCNGKYTFMTVRFRNGVLDLEPLAAARAHEYTWRLSRERTHRAPTAA
jgi:hypothetical protein